MRASAESTYPQHPDSNHNVDSTSLPGLAMLGIRCAIRTSTGLSSACRRIWARLPSLSSLVLTRLQSTGCSRSRALGNYPFCSGQDREIEAPGPSVCIRRPCLLAAVVGTAKVTCWTR